MAKLSSTIALLLFLSQLIHAEERRSLWDGCDRCGESLCCCDGRAVGSQWSAGFDAVFIRPHFESNLAFTTRESDGATFDRITDSTFNYDFHLSPRAWVGYQSHASIGARAVFWSFDQSADVVATNPPTNGFGEITHPVFGGIDVSSTIPTDTFSAQSGLDLYSIDLEITKFATFYEWDILVSGGLRYGWIEQDYNAELRNLAGGLVGQIAFTHGQRGIGPTFAIETKRPLCSGLSSFGAVRGSLLFGKADTALAAGEDLDLVTPFFTTRGSERDDVSPIGEIKIGLDWSAPESSLGTLLVRGAFEGQLWSGVGNASSENGDLGLLGFTVGIGLVR